MRVFSSLLLAGIWLAAQVATSQTDWTYQPTNAFPGLVFSNPICLATPPGETNRLFVVEKHGRIIVITNLAAPTRTVFMDITSKVRVGNSSESADVSGEEGLLGLVFHPDYAANRYFYIFYTATNGTARDDILACYQTTATNANVCLTNSEIRFLVQFDEANNHNGGDLHFGPDGYLYVALGDEGGVGDSYNNSQRIDKDYFSAIMRIDVDKKPENLPPNPHPSLPSLTNYFVPADNPWVGATNFNGITVDSNSVRTEFWAVGMRNPWRYSFDPATGELYLGHVGQNRIESVDIVTNGANCGWNFYEGDQPYAGIPPPGFTFTHPLTEYSHTTSRYCVIGGFVCRGTRWPALNGAYLYADYGSGEVWALKHAGTNVTQNLTLFTNIGARISGFGVDPSNGDPLYCALRSGDNSIIQRIISTNTAPIFTGLVISGDNIIFTGTNGPPGGNYYVLTSTNLLAPGTNWSRIATNSFDSNGNFNFTNSFNLVSNLFYRLQVQ
jgi:glucose/arabinose dehydrogenase